MEDMKLNTVTITKAEFDWLLDDLETKKLRMDYTLNQYDEDAHKFATYDDPLYPVLGLAEEAGEVVGKFAKALRGDRDEADEDAVVKELGDVLWMLNECCHYIGVSLEDVALKNIGKLKSRLDRGVIKGDGDER